MYTCYHAIIMFYMMFSSLLGERCHGRKQNSHRDNDISKEMRIFDEWCCGFTEVNESPGSHPAEKTSAVNGTSHEFNITCIDRQ